MLVKPRGSLALFSLFTMAAAPAISAVDDHARVAEAYGKVPLQFEANRGQADDAVRFLAHGAGYSLYLAPEEAMLVLAKSGLRRSKRSAKSIVSPGLRGP